MAGSDGSHAQRGSQPPPHWPADGEEHARAQDYERWQHQQRLAAEQAYAQQGRPGYPPQAGYAPHSQHHAQSGQSFQSGHASQHGHPSQHAHSTQHGHSSPNGHSGGQHPVEPPFYEPQLAGPSFGQPQDAAYPEHPPHHHAPHHQAPHHQLGYGQPGPAPHDLGLRPAVYSDHEPTGRPSPDFAPQFERFGAPPQPAPNDPFARFDPGQSQGYAEPAPYDHRGLAANPNVANPFEPHRGGQGGYHVPTPSGHQPAGYGMGPDYGGQPAEARGDVQSWDLSQYQPGQIPQDYAAQGHPGGHDGRAHPGWQQAPQDAWQQPHAAGGQAWSPQGGQPGYAPQDGYGHPNEPGFDAQGGPAGGYDADELEPAEPVRRGPSTLLIVGALIAAIGIGGGLAFAYKQFGGGGKSATQIAELERPTTPTKERPQDPGGRTIEHSDKKFLNRLANDAAPVETARANDIDGAAKKVSTIPIIVNRDGSLSPQVPRETAEAAPSSGVPGLLIDGMGPPPGAAPSRGPVQAQPVNVPPTARIAPPPLPPPPAVAPAPPRVADLPLPRVVQQPLRGTQTEIVGKAPVPKRGEAQRDDLIAQQAGGGVSTKSGLGSAAAKPAPRVTAATGGSGYVAVLASKKTRQEALNSFADLHAQYPAELAGMTPDVREANLGDKGLWYRLIVGPPGSRESARTLCVKLKDRGMKDCWPVAY